MANDPIIEKTIALPLDYVFTARIRPSSVKRTAFRLLPWALVVMLPGKRSTKTARAIAMRLFPLSRYKIR